MNYKYDELKYAELIYTKGFQSKHIPTELRLLVLYYRDILELKPKEREVTLYRFCKQYIPNFKKARFFKTVNRALSAGLKKEQKLISISEIEVYDTELYYINSLDIKYDYKKVMFTFLIQMKLNKKVYEYKYNKEYDSIYFKGGRKKYNNIKEISNIPIKMKLNDEVINELSKLGLVTILHNGMIVLNYLTECKSDGGVTVIVNDFENIGLSFDYYNNVNGVVRCEKCSKIIKKKSNRQTMCEDCSQTERRKYKTEKQREYRNNNCVDI